MSRAIAIGSDIQRLNRLFAVVGCEFQPVFAGFQALGVVPRLQVLSRLDLPQLPTTHQHAIAETVQDTCVDTRINIRPPGTAAKHPAVRWS